MPLIALPETISLIFLNLDLFLNIFNLLLSLYMAIYMFSWGVFFGRPFEGISL